MGMREGSQSLDGCLLLFGFIWWENREICWYWHLQTLSSRTHTQKKQTHQQHELSKLVWTKWSWLLRRTAYPLVIITLLRNVRCIHGRAEWAFLHSFGDTKLSSHTHKYCSLLHSSHACLPKAEGVLHVLHVTPRSSWCWFISIDISPQKFWWGGWEWTN